MSSRANAPLNTYTMNFIARAFNRNIGSQPSVVSIAVDAQNVVTSNNNDRVDIRAGAFNRGGYAEATGLNNSTVSTLAGDDAVRIQANARGLSTNAWAMRNSTLNVGNGNDKVDLRASTQAGAFDPAYGAEGSTILLGNGQDNLRINASARGNTTDTIAAYGTVNSQTNTGADNDRVEIGASAVNRRGISEAAALDSSSLETEGGDDLVRIKTGAYGKETQAWGMRDSEANTGSGQDSLRINAEARGNTTGTIAAYGALNSLTNTGADNDRIDIRATASNRGGTAEAVGLDASDLTTEGGDDRIRIQANASGQYTYAWAMRDSFLDAGSGSNFIDLRASTLAFGVDPAYGVDSSSIVSGNDQDNLRINANARGNTTGTIAAYGAVNAQIDLGGADNKLEIDAKATNRRGTAQAVGLDASTATTGSGDDVVRVSAYANGGNQVVWAMRNSTLDVGAGDDKIDINGNALESNIRTGDGFDTIKISGLETDQLQIDSGADDDVLKVDGGTRISFVSGDGSDQLQLTRNYFTSLIQSSEVNKEMSQSDQLKVTEATTEDQSLVLKEPLPFAESQLNLRNALKFEDFTTGEGGDSFNVDDILRSYGVGLKRQSIFADGFLSFQQNGNDSVLLFDADGAVQQTKSNMALVVFKDVEASAFSTENLDSRLVNEDDFNLNQEQQQTAIPAVAVAAPIENEAFEPALEGQLITEFETDPITGVVAGQALANGTVQPAPEPFNLSSTNAQSLAMGASQPLANTPLDTASAGLESAVTFSPLPELEAGSSLSTPALGASTVSFNPFAASPSSSGSMTSQALSLDVTQAPADIV